MRLIDAGELIKKLGDAHFKNYGNAIMVVNDTPTVDAVEVVRCNDCKYNYNNLIPSGEAEHGCTKYIELPITGDFYCAWGERE